jgi:hypothetical protein
MVAPDVTGVIGERERDLHLRIFLVGIREIGLARRPAWTHSSFRDVSRNGVVCTRDLRIVALPPTSDCVRHAARRQALRAGGSRKTHFDELLFVRIAAVIDGEGPTVAWMLPPQVANGLDHERFDLFWAKHPRAAGVRETLDVFQLDVEHRSPLH